MARLRLELQRRDASTRYRSGFATRHSCDGKNVACRSPFCPRCRPLVKAETARRWVADFDPAQAFFPTIMFDQRRATRSKEVAAGIVTELLDTAIAIARQCNVAARFVPEIKCSLVEGKPMFWPHIHGIAQAPNDDAGHNFDKALRNAFGKNKAVVCKSIDVAVGGIARLAHYVCKGQTDWVVKLPNGRDVYDADQPIDRETISFLSDCLTGREVAFGNPLSKMRDVVVMKQVTSVAVHVTSPQRNSLSNSPCPHKQNVVRSDHLTWIERRTRAKIALERIRSGNRALSTL